VAWHPVVALCHGGAQPREDRFGGGAIAEERAARAGIDHPRLARRHAEAAARCILVAADRDQGARAHVLFLNHHLGDAFLAVVAERLVGMLKQVFTATGRARRHGWGQMDQPFRMHAEARHHLERGGAGALVDDDVATEAGFDDALACDQGEVEQVVVLLLKAERAVRAALEGPHRLGIDAVCRHLDQFLLRPAQGGELTAEHAACVEADRVVQPFRRNNGRVAVDDGGLALIVGGPVMADGQAEFVGLAGRLTIEASRSSWATPLSGRSPASMTSTCLRSSALRGRRNDRSVVQFALKSGHFCSLL
jgi:hypothetical protein